MRKTALASVVAVVVLAVGALFSRDLIPLLPLSAAARPAVRIADPDFLSYSLVRLADQRGLFRRSGAPVQLVKTANGRDALELLMDGKVDFACAAGTPVAYALLDGRDVMILAGLSTVDGAHAIVAPRGTGVRSPHDLRGKTIAVSPRTSSEFFLDRYLDFHGIPQRAVPRVIVEADTVEAMLSKPGIDGVCTFRPWLTPGKDFVRLGGDGIYTWNGFLVTRRSMIEEHPDVVGRVLSSLVAAEKFAVEHRQEMPRLLAGTYGMDVRTFETVWNSMRFGVSLDHAMLRGLEDEARWALERRGPFVGSPSPDFLGAFHFKALSGIRPDAVTIVHNGDALQ